jgi:hypothetical protein
MAPSPLNSPHRVLRRQEVPTVHAAAAASYPGLGVPFPVAAASPVRCEEEATQTEDLDASFAASDVWSTDSAIEESDESESAATATDSVMERLSRRVGSLFSQVQQLRRGVDKRERVLPQDRHHRGTQTAKDPLASETEKLAFDIVFYVLGRRSSRAPDETTECLRRSVAKMLEKHSLVFNSMVSRLHLSRESDLHKGFQDLSNELFVHNEVLDQFRCTRQ